MIGSSRPQMPERDGMAVQTAKDLVWSIWATGGRDGRIAPHSASEGSLAPDLAYHGPAPIDRLSGRDAVIARYHAPLARAFADGRREVHLFLGGSFEGSIWVATAGHFVGRMTKDWCGVPGGGDERRLRFGEFYRVENGQVVELRCLLDIPGLAAQAGYRLLPPFGGRDTPAPGPALVNGVCRGPQSPVETEATIRLVEDMLGGCNRLEGSDLASMGMGAFWHDDMVWHGPWGVGSCYGFREFEAFAQGPSVQSFPNRRGGFHRARFAEGLTAAFTGWPSLRGDFTGKPFRGLAPTGGPIGQNIMDFYVRRGGKLHENWVLIDLVDFARQCGVDLLAALPGER